MARCSLAWWVLAFAGHLFPAFGQPGTIPRFEIRDNPIQITRPARASTYFDKVGREFALLATESGEFEAWAYPLKILREFEFSFFIGSSTEPIHGRDIARWITVRPEATTITYTYQSFTIRATYVTSIDRPGALILLAVDATEPLSIACSFLPVMQPMWPAGIGGQYASWDNATRAYLISEPTRTNHGFVGSPSAEGMSYTPAHMLSDVPNQFRISVPSPDSVRSRFIVVALAGGKGKRDSVRAEYLGLVRDPENVYAEAASHYAALTSSTMSVETPDSRFNLAYEWAKVAYDNLMVRNPDLGTGLVAGLGQSGSSGRPGFGWFFGGDAFINSFSLNAIGATSIVRDALSFTQKWQRDDGKMMHELSQAAGYIDWFKDYPYAYIHGDTSPFYIAAMYDYFSSTADSAFIQKSWESVRRAFTWSRATDEDGDGLMDNAKAGLGASEYGSLTGVQSDIYTAAVWVRALSVIGRLAHVAGDKEFAPTVEPLRAKAAAAFRTKFWDAKRGQYAYAFDAAGTPLSVLSPWSSVGIMWGLGDSARSVQTLEKLGSAELTTDWGIRSISHTSPLFEPLNYNYGAVWPFLSGWVAAAQYEARLPLQAYGTLLANVRHTFDNGAGVITEVFSGSQNVWPQEAVAHQGFSTSGVILPFVRGMLGLSTNAAERSVAFAPQLPADWKFAAIRNCSIGQDRVSLHYMRDDRRATLRAHLSGGLPVHIRFAPAFGPGTHAIRESVVNFTLSDSATVAIDFVRGVELLPPSNETQTGDGNTGLKIIGTNLRGTSLRVVVEGLSGSEYTLGAANPAKIEAVEGARKTGAGLQISMPQGKPGEFVRKEIVIRVKND